MTKTHLLTIPLEHLADFRTPERPDYAPQLKHALLETYISFELRFMNGRRFYDPTDLEEYVATVMESLEDFDRLSETTRIAVLYGAMSMMLDFMDILETLTPKVDLNLLELFPSPSQHTYVALIMSTHD